MSDTHYVGKELERFEFAENWKSYWGSLAAPYLKGTVVEVGAGLGGSTRNLLERSAQDRWICVEPDEKLSCQIPDRVKGCRGADTLEIHTGYLTGLTDRLGDTVDAALYIDVIEHIEDDRAELEVAREVLKPGGALLVLVPAHQFLFSPFDEALGHYRRYNKPRLRQALPEGFTVESIRYLDSVGLFASLANRCLLKQSMPGAKQIAFWNKWMVPVSRCVDPLLLYGFGKSLLMVARKSS